LESIMFNRIQSFRQALGDKAATTRPVDAATPIDWGSFANDVRQLKELKTEKAESMRNAYADTLVEIAWVQTYFHQSGTDGKAALDALRELAPEDSAAVARLEGWAFFFKGDKDAARVKLAAVKDRDPIAQIGLIRMTEGPEAEK